MKVIAGVDIGFGDTKVYTKDTNLKFPTSIAIDYDRGVDLVEFGGKRKSYEFNNSRYIVGEEALLYDPLPTRNVSFLLKYTPVLLYHTYAQLKNFFDFVALGLPIGYFKDYGKQIRSSITNFAINGNQQAFGAIVMPQGIGIACDYMYNDDGSVKNLMSNAVVVDIGYNTIDIVVIAKGVANPQLSTMLTNSGICKIVTKLQETLQKKHNEDIPEYLAKKFLNDKKSLLYGESEDLTTIISNLIEEYADRTINEILIKMANTLKQSDLLIFSGGGSALIKDFIKDEHRRKITFVGDKLSDYSNARGFYKYALRKFTHENNNT